MERCLMRQSCGGSQLRSGRGFTLIELLVVVAIIALLVSILLPSLNRARQRAKDLVCRTQLRNLGVALTSYNNEENDAIPLNTNQDYQVAGYNQSMRRYDYPWPMLMEAHQGKNDNIHICPMMSDNFVPLPRTEFATAWEYWEQVPKPGESGRYATSYQMKPDLGTTESFVPSMGSRFPSNSWQFARFFKYHEDGEWTISANMEAVFGETQPHKIITRANQIKRPSETLVFTDRWEWHKRTERGVDKEMRQLVNADGSALQVENTQTPGFVDTPFYKDHWWYRSYEGRALVAVNPQQ